MPRSLFARSFFILFCAIVLLPLPRVCSAQDKFIGLDDIPRYRGHVTVNPDGSKVIIASSDYLVFDAQGKLTARIGFPTWGTSGMRLYPLPDGRWLSLIHGLSGHLAMCYPDGRESRTLVGFGNDLAHLRFDVNWTSPDDMAVDVAHQRIFILDSTDSAPLDARHIVNPDRSRIAVFDFDGKYINDINRHDAYGPDRAKTEADPDVHTRYNAIAVDPARQRVYVLARTGKLMAFDYDGTPRGKVKVSGSALTVLPDGTLVVGGQKLETFDPDLKSLDQYKIPSNFGAVETLAADNQGRLYATTQSPAVIFARWNDLKDTEHPQTFDVSYLQLHAQFPNESVAAGKSFEIGVSASGNPEPVAKTWHVLARPADGSSLQWKELACVPGGADPHLPAEQRLEVTAPVDFDGFYEIVVRWGDGPIEWARHGEDPSILHVLAFAPQGATKSVSAISDSARHAFRQGEAIPVEIVRRDGPMGSKPFAPIPVKITLLDSAGKTLASSDATVIGQSAMAIDADYTRFLLPGHYRVSVAADGYASHDYQFDLATSLADSPLQRILYCEFAGGGTTQDAQEDSAENLSGVRQYAAAEARLGFTRETDRLLLQQGYDGPHAWQRWQTPAPDTDAAMAPGDYYSMPSGPDWAAETFYDQAVRYGLHLDSHLLGHCDGVLFTDAWLTKVDPQLQRSVQWLSRYPSLYGINYNDEMFFGGYASRWSKDDVAALDEIQKTQLVGHPMADVYMVALRRMYDSFNLAARTVDPEIHLTATPMWQYPAPEGSYPPVIYQGMSESYSHYMSEGQHVPWFAPHSAEMLRRPDLPLMGVIDNGHSGQGGNLYMMDAMQVLARGAQGAGQALTNALGGVGHGYVDPFGADAYRTVNLLGAMYGPVFAQATPMNEAYVLYSYAQDITEKRHSEGTPHWERVYGMYCAGLMSGVPMQITYEQDIAAGQLMDGKKPRVPMLFLVGQTQPLLAAVLKRIAEFQAAGGVVLVDADSNSALVPGAKQLDLHPSAVSQPMAECMNTDAWFPGIGQPLEILAHALHRETEQYRRYPMDTDDFWVSKNRLQGGDVSYLMLASESSPLPFDSGTAWGMGIHFFRLMVPKTISFAFPATTATMYDVFDHQLITPNSTAPGRNHLTVDLRKFPGRLYALLPAPIAAPGIETAVGAHRFDYRVSVLDANGKRIAGLVPLRIRLMSGDQVAAEIFRGSDAAGVSAGTFSGSFDLPSNAPGDFSLQATELLSGKTSIALISPVSEDIKTQQPVALKPRADVEVFRRVQLSELLAAAQRSGVTLISGPNCQLTPAQVTALTDAFKSAHVTLNVGTLAAKPAAGLYLAAGYVGDPGTMGELLLLGQEHGQFDYCVSPIIPGAGRGMITALYAPRGYQEDCIALLGGDRGGLDKTVDAMVAYFKGNKLDAPAGANDKLPPLADSGKAVEDATLPSLNSMVGVQLGEILVAPDGKHLLITAPGFEKNLALLADDGDAAKIDRIVRAGQGQRLNSLFISADGSRFGASVHEAARFDEGFHLLNAQDDTSGNVFAAFGAYESHEHHFAVSDDGNTVIAPGQFGYVCWKRQGDQWKESWSFDYWKEFGQMEWPISASDERRPQFHAYIPRGADYAIIVWGETTDNGWVTPEFHYKAAVWAVNLSDGKQRWRFDVPIKDAFLQATLYSSQDGGHLLVQAQIGSFGKAHYRFYPLDNDGKGLGSWDSQEKPVSVVVSDATGDVALLYSGRLLEMRRASGKLIHNRIWDYADPLSLAYTPDGKGLYVADNSGLITRLNAATGDDVWQAPDGGVAYIAAGSQGVYAAGWDGRLRAVSPDGKPRWTINLSPSLDSPDALRQLYESTALPKGALIEADRPSTTSHDVPAGPSLITPQSATVKVEGTGGYDSSGRVLVKAEELVNGQRDDVDEGWIPLSDLGADGPMGRQAYIEVDFKKPTDVATVTVFENPKHPQSFPTEGLVQTWNEKTKAWDTAARGVFLNGPVNTYQVNLHGATKIRYAPWAAYCHNFYTSEIEMR